MNAKYPLFEVAAQGKKKVIWVNIFKTNIEAIVFIVIILFMAIQYQSDTKVCADFQKDPCEYLPAYNQMCINNTYTLFNTGATNDNINLSYLFNTTTE